MTTFKRLLLVSLVVFGVVLPFFSNSYILRAASIFYIYFGLGAGLSIIVSYAGLLNLGYAAFFAIGAYSYALLNLNLGWSFGAAIPVGIIIAGFLGFLIGFPTLRVRGDYLALVTLAFGEITRVLLLNIWGPHGLSGISPPVNASAIGGIENMYLIFYFVTFLPFPLCIWGLSKLSKSRLSSTWFAIRDNELAARFSGIYSMPWLLLALVLGAAIAGGIGVLFAGVQRFVSPGSFTIEESIYILSIVVIAGTTSPLRLIIAATVLAFLPEMLRGFADFRLLIFGLLLSTFVVAEEKLKPFFERNRKTRQNTSCFTIEPDFNKIASLASSSNTVGFAQNFDVGVSSLSMRFGGVIAVDNVTFDVSLAGKAVALIGPNGAGKTTLFNCISGYHQPTAGSVEFPGLNISRKPSSIAKAGIARTFQTPQLFHSMTVRENIETAAIHANNPKNFAQTTQNILEYLGLDKIAEMNATLLPLGFQRMIELGRALALQPRIVLVDEIASGLNSWEKEKMAQLIKQLANEKGIGFLIVEHDMDFVLPLAKEVLVMESGRLIARGLPGDIVNNPAVVNAYLGGSYAAA
jgi:branched-chain amino acid transport system permease protein